MVLVDFDDGHDDKPRLKKRTGNDSISDACIAKLISNSTSSRKSPELIRRIRQLINDTLYRLLEAAVDIRGPQSHTIDVSHVVQAIHRCHLPTSAISSGSAAGATSGGGSSSS